MKLKGILRAELETTHKLLPTVHYLEVEKVVSDALTGYNHGSETEHFTAFLMFVCEKPLVSPFCPEAMKTSSGGVELEGLSFEVLPQPKKSSVV